MIIRNNKGQFVKGSLREGIKIKVNCSHCEKVIHKIPSLVKNRTNHFCNHKCKSQWQVINLKGSNNPFFNKKHSNYSMIQSSITKRELYQKGIIKSWNTGLTKKTNSKLKNIGINISKTKKEQFKTGILIPFHGKPNPTTRPEVREKIRKFRLSQKIPFRNTSIEIKLYKELNQRNIIFEKYKPILNITQPDAFIKPNICIYADGDYWHNRDDNKVRDNKINEKLNQGGYKVLRFWEHEINKDVVNCVNQIEKQI